MADGTYWHIEIGINSAAECSISFKFGMWVRRGFTQVARYSPTVKSKVEVGPKFSKF